ncbi:hypothetical protein RJ640_003852 [Escallonia rubra]|uniref:Large ribosomal subunit protein bL32m n=1 Tax=Escallonia rubra TaxID=112253 RepID=A0AA88RDR3_9ASTE|nr:hypothetical protein RJ640_003852 [Escallonia rubra]
MYKVTSQRESQKEALPHTPQEILLTTPHKKGIRNGPKALKPTPVIIRCKVCGRVKLPHFFCCSGIRDTDEQKGPNN